MLLMVICNLIVLPALIELRERDVGADYDRPTRADGLGLTD
jgi:hypothetical protein